MYLFVVFVFLLVGQSFGDSGVKKQLISIRSLERRNEMDHSRELQLEAFGKDYHLLLERSEIFSPDFQFVTVSGTSAGNTVLSKRALEQDELGDFYSDKDGSASLFISDRDKIEINGILARNILIRSLKSEDIQGELDHEVTLSNLMLNNGEGDYVIPREIHRRDETNASSTDSFPSRVVVELCPFLDYNNSKALQKDMKAAAQYCGVFYNNVNLRFNATKDPDIRIVLSCIIMVNDSNHEPFPKSKISSPNRIDQSILDDLRDWLNAKEDELPKHDSVLLHLSYDVGSYEDDGTWNGHLAGLAFRGTTCSTGGYNSAYAEDIVPLFTGVLVVPHEIAHGLDVPHDGDEQASTCPASNGNIMGSGQFGENSFQFSSCSLECMKNFVRSDKAKCLQGSFRQTYYLISRLPGMMLDPDEQCAARHGKNYISKKLFDQELCQTLWCGLEGSSFTSSGAALDGTACGLDKMCMNGFCVDNSIPSADEQCRNNFGSLYRVANKQRADFCEKLLCTWNGVIGKWKGPPITGSLCGNGGRCYEKKCGSEVPDFNNQCERLFNGTFTAYIKNMADVCRALGCRGPDGRILSYGGAMEGTSCGFNSICKNGVCSLL